MQKDGYVLHWTAHISVLFFHPNKYTRGVLPQTNLSGLSEKINE